MRMAMIINAPRVALPLNIANVVFHGTLSIGLNYIITRGEATQELATVLDIQCNVQRLPQEIRKVCDGSRHQR